MRLQIRPATLSLPWQSRALLFRPVMISRRTIVYLDGLQDPSFQNRPQPGAAITDEQVSEIKECWQALTNGDVRYSLPSDLLVQVFTHKSFDNGWRPYNQRLGLLGHKLYSLNAALLLQNDLSSSAEAINGQNLTLLASKTAGKLLNSRGPAHIVAKDTNVSSKTLWTPANKDKYSLEKAEANAGVVTIFAAIGALALQYGTPTAEKFAREIVLLGPNGVLVNKHGRKQTQNKNNQK
ncbi:hypothetical protein V1514DRAFT_287807 [Lipomyces japonicus]|uniref:mitochondrial 54S ribosomal protein mL57 n=1 Tax=Lipomyces japonicus TaxID=56871 RepID=UPI0034CD1460